MAVHTGVPRPGEVTPVVAVFENDLELARYIATQRGYPLYEGGEICKGRYMPPGTVAVIWVGDGHVVDELIELINGGDTA